MADEETQAPPAEEAPQTLLEAAREADEKLQADGGDTPAVAPVEGEAPAKPAVRDADGRFVALARKSRREKQRIERASAELSQREQSLRLAEADRKELDELRQIRTLARERPDEVVSRLGIDIGTLTDRLVSKGTPEEKIFELEARINREAKEREERETQARSQAQEAAKAAAEAKFAEEAGPDKYPALAVLDPEDVIAKGYRIGREIKQHFIARGEHGRDPTNEEILAEMNARQAARMGQRAPAAAPSRAPARTLTGGGSRARVAAFEEPDLGRAMTSGERAQAIVDAMRKAGLR
jgi:hypothetical protein